MAAAVPFGNFAAPRPQPGERESPGLGYVYLQPLTHRGGVLSGGSFANPPQYGLDHLHRNAEIRAV
jgi:hypothetical protein